MLIGALVPLDMLKLKIKELVDLVGLLVPLELLKIYTSNNSKIKNHSQNNN